jgi:hypothetical protein
MFDHRGHTCAVTFTYDPLIVEIIKIGATTAGCLG